MKAKLTVTADEIEDVLENGTKSAADALAETVNKEEHINGLGGYTEEELDWDSIPEDEKVSEDEIDFLEAREAGRWDGVNDALNKRVSQLIAEKDGEKLHHLRKSVESGEFAEQFKSQRVSKVR
jgi:hypothetical protein